MITDAWWKFLLSSRCLLEFFSKSWHGLSAFQAAACSALASEYNSSRCLLFPMLVTYRHTGILYIMMHDAYWYIYIYTWYIYIYMIYIYIYIYRVVPVRFWRFRFDFLYKEWISRELVFDSIYRDSDTDSIRNVSSPAGSKCDGSREEPGLPKLCGTWIGQDQKYAIGEQCGAGTYGVAYKATDRRTGVIVAVKIELRCETIHTELACLDSLRGHPAFLQVEDSHVDWRGLSWMIMPMLKTSLRQLLPVAPDAQMAVCVQSLSGLSYMHDNLCCTVT